MAFFIPNGIFVALGNWVDMPGNKSYPPVLPPTPSRLNPLYINKGAMIFLLIQIVLLIDFAYSVSENLLARWEDEGDQKSIGFLLA